MFSTGAPRNNTPLSRYDGYVASNQTMSRLKTFTVACRWVLTALLLGGAVAQAQTKDTLVYVGTYTGGKSKSEGIYLFRLQTRNLEVSQNITLVPLGLAAQTPSPS